MRGHGYQPISGGISEATEADFSQLMLDGVASQAVTEARFSPIKATWIGYSIVLSCIVCIIAEFVPLAWEHDLFHYKVFGLQAVLGARAEDILFVFRVVIHLLCYITILVHANLLGRERQRLNKIGYLATAQKILQIENIFSTVVTVCNVLCVALLCVDVVIDQGHTAYASYCQARVIIILIVVCAELIFNLVLALRLWTICSQHNKRRPTPDSLAYLDTDGVLAAVGSDAATVEQLLERQAQTVRILMGHERVLVRELHRARELLAAGERGGADADERIGFISTAHATRLVQERADAMRDLEAAKNAAARREAAIQLLEAELAVRDEAAVTLQRRLREAQELAEHRSIILEIMREKAENAE